MNVMNVMMNSINHINVLKIVLVADTNNVKSIIPSFQEKHSLDYLCCFKLIYILINLKL